MGEEWLVTVLLPSQQPEGFRVAFFRGKDHKVRDGNDPQC
jgi:hypothetical protein